MNRIALCALALTTVFACSRDLSLPDQPQRSSVRGVIDTGGHLVPGGLGLKLIRTDTGERYSAVTETDGSFQFPDVTPAASYQLNGDFPGFAPLREGPFQVLGGTPTDLGTLTPVWLISTPSEARVVGVVRVAEVEVTDAGLVDAGNVTAAAQGATVHVLSEEAGDQEIDAVTVDAAGGFSLRLPPGRYTLRVDHPLYVSGKREGLVLGEGARVDLTPEPLLLGINPSTLTGHVSLELDRSPDAGVGVAVTVTSDTGRSVTTDMSGAFSLPGLPAGTRTLRFSKANYHAVSDLQAQLGAAETRDVGTVRLLLDRGSLSGTVEMADGSPLQSVTVSIAGTTYVTNAVADETVPARGTFLLTDVPVGAYTVRAARASYVSASSPTATVTWNGVTDVGLLRLVRVQGDFQIDDGDATNTAGYTRTTAVTLRLSNVVNAASYRVVEGDGTALAAASYQAFSSANIPFTLSAGDGEKRLLLQIKDNNNNESAPLSASVVLDQTAPSQVSLSIAGGAGFTNVANPLPLTVNAVDTGSGLVLMRVAGSGALDGNGELQVPRSAYVRDATFTRSSSADGVQSVFVQVTDNAGNVSAVATNSIVVDTIAPTGTVSIDRGQRASVDGYTNTVQALLTVTPGGLEPNGGYLRLKLANSLADLATATPQAVSGSVGWFLDPVGEGTKTVHYRYVDAAGNESPPQQATILYDASSPAVSAALTTAAITNSRTVGLQINATDLNPLSPTRGLTLSESALFSGATGTAFPMSGAATFNLTAGDGPRVVYVRVTDAAGNEGTSSVSVTLDETVPAGLAITLVGTLADGTTSTAISSSLGLQVNLAQVGATGVLLTESSLTTCPASGYQTITGPSAVFNLGASGGTTRTVRACFIDAAGNVGPVVSDTIDLDVTTPSGCAITLAGRRADGSATALDKTALNGITWSLSGCTEVPLEIFLTESPTTCSASASFTWQGYDAAATNTLTLSAIDGTKTVRGCVRDRARNVSSFVADGIVLDTTPPGGASVLIDSGAAFLNAATRIARGNQSQVSVAGTASGATEWAIAESATPTTFSAFPGTSPANFVFSAGEGERIISALFRDDVGNVSTLVSDEIVIDTLAPTLTALTLTGDLADASSSETVSASTSARASLVQSGATLVLFGDATLSACPTTGYSSYSGGTVPVTLTGSGTTRTVRACVSDAAGNVAGPVADTIDVDSSTPTGCQLVLTGRRADGTTSGIAKTARDTIGISTSGCTETPTEIALIEASTVTCAAANGLSWVALTGANTVTLSAGDGAKNLIGCVRDRARNTGGLAAAAITLDTQAPTGVSASIEAGAAYFNAALSTARGGLVANVTGAATGAAEWAIAEGTTPTSFSAFVAATPKSLTLSSGDGVKTVQALFRDDVGNTSTLVTDTIEVDTTLPTLTALVLSGPLADGTSNETVTNGTAVTATLTTTGASLVSFSTTSVTTCPASVSSYTALTGSTAPATLGASGTTRALWACVSDAAGNVAGPVTDTIDVDSSTPTGCQLVLTGRRADGTTSGIAKTARDTIGISTSGCTETPTEIALIEASTVTCAAANGLSWVALTGANTVTLSAGDGAKNLIGCVRDRARNTGGLAAAAITLDTQAPTGVSASIEAGAAYFNAALSTARGGLVANVTGAATGAAEWAIAEGTTPTSFSAFVAATPKSLTLSSGDGVKTVQALFRDDVGNTSTLVTDTIEVDTTLPTLTALVLSGPLADGTSSEAVTNGTAVTATLTTTGASLVSFSTTSVTTCPASVSSYTALTGATAPATLGASGTTRSLWACVSDAAGNVAGPVTDAIDVDATTPSGCQLTLVGRRTDGSAANPALNKTATRDVGIGLGGCSEVPTEVALLETSTAPTCSPTANLNWVAFSAGTTSLALSSGDATKTVVGCVRDRARNTNSFAQDTIVLDATAPTGATVSIKSGAAWFNLADYTAAPNANIISVSGSASGATEWALAEGATPSSFTDLATTSPRNFTFSVGDGTKTIRALFRDDVGNTTSVEAQDSIDVDTSPPTLTSVLLTGTLADGFTSNSSTASTSVTATLGTSGASGVYFSTSSLSSCPNPAGTTYATLLGTTASATLSAGTNPRTVWSCVSDAAGNTAGPVSDGIDLDATAPTGCTVSITGYRADGVTAAPAGQTATRDVIISVTGCSETITDISLSEGSTPTCASTGVIPWTTYAAGMRFTLSSGDNSKTVQACVRDTTRNAVAASAGTVVLDSTAPTAGPSITINAGATYFNRADYVAAGNTIQVSVAGSASGATEWALGESPTPTSFRSTSGVGNNPWVFTMTSGEGLRKLYAIFRDSLGNATTAEISDTITVDTVAPSTTGVSVSAQGPTANEFTNSAVVTVRITNPPTDAVSAQLAQAASAIDCVDSDLASAISQGLVSSYSFSLTPTEGLKRVCVRFVDAAGNPSVMTASPEPYADTVTLDTTSPTTPTIVDRDQYVRLAEGSNFSVTIASASVDSNFANYEKLGGAATTWQLVTPTGLSFPFSLVNDGSESGTRNALRLRARDQAGNVSGESVVFVTADTNPPNAPLLPDGGVQGVSWQLLDEWVDNTRNAATAYWKPSTSADIASYRVSYGSSTGQLNGTFATQGASPVFTPRPDQTYLTLSGLPNNSQTWFQVEPVDLAGNIGPASQLKSMQPGVVSPNAVATLSLTNNVGVTGSVFTERLATFGRWLYVASRTSGCTSTLPSTCGTQLQIVDLGGSESAIQRGTINPNPGVPTQSPTVLYWATDNAVSTNGVPPLDMIIDGPLLFLAAGRFVHILNLANPASPSTLVDLDLSAINANYRVHGVSLIGDKLVLAGRRADVTNVTLHAVVQLSKLYDNNSSTRPTTSDVAVVETSYSPGPMVVTRDRLIVGGSGGGNYELVRLADALDPEPASGTVWTSADASTFSSGFVLLAARPPTSGNLLFGGGSSSGFSVFDGSGLWAGSAMVAQAATAFEAPAQFDVIGSEAFLPDQDGDGIRVLELSDLSFIQQSGRYSVGLSPTAVTTWGHYGVITTSSGGAVQLRVVELATPRALTERATAVNAGFDMALRPGLALTASRRPFDLLNGPAPSSLAVSSLVTCTYRSAFVDDIEVGGRDGGLYIFDEDALLDRDVATSPTAVSPETYVANDFPLTTRISGIVQWGNYLVLAEVRNTGSTATDGVWLDVLDARSLRDRYAATVLVGQANRVAEYRVLASPANQGTMMADVTMNEGRAAVSIDDGVGNSIGTNVYFVDLRPVFDDDGSTILSASSLQGSVSNLGRARRTVIQGTTAYIATAAKVTSPTAPGLVIVSVPEVMDELPATTLPASPTRTSMLDATPTGSVTVYGSALFVAPSDSYSSSGLYVIDVSQPMSPTIQNFYPMSLGTTYCDNTAFAFRARVTVGGSRLYLSDGTLHVFDLE